MIIVSALFLSLSGLLLYGYLSDGAPFPITDDRQSTYEGSPEKEDVGPGIRDEFYISPLGSDENDGLSWKSPFLSIQKAIYLAGPGSAIHLADGTYMQNIVSKRDGTAKNPIRITGSPSSIVQGGKISRVIEINHSFITLENFTVDGLVGSPDEKSGFRDKLIYVQGKGDGKGVTGLKVLKMSLKNAGGECVRLRYFAQKNEIADNTITGCGAYDFLLDGKGKNGEGIYIGTAPEQTDDGKNPTDERDHSNGNWVHGNTIDTQGNECVDVKEGSSGNLVENNVCTGQKDSESGGLDSRGNGNIFRNNLVYGNAGAGIRLGGDEDDDGKNNDVYLNTIRDNEGVGIKVQRYPQGKICGNVLSGNDGGEITEEYAEDIANEACD
ncbi:MAG TPA: hypothetical protein DD454_04165 [Candidatus Moranbacteria bacterium]|nr:hypothetical protein [Candidatus Moranbacteria bacterium]